MVINIIEAIPYFYSYTHSKVELDMKIVFLDFDGVIRLPEFGGAYIGAEFCSDCIKRVGDLCQHTNSNIVISSDWRLRKRREEIIDILTPSIPSERIHEHWATPSLKSVDESAVPRGAEILSWLHHHPNVAEFVILDDLPSRHFPALEKHLVKSKLEDGFTEKLLQEAIHRLTLE